MKHSLRLLVFLSVIFAGSAMAQTNVSGGIFANTTWTAANSPYIVTGNIVLFPGYVLTIQPGVTVKFTDSTNIEIRQSKLVAIGTSTSPITFTRNNPQSSSRWGNISLNNALSVRFDYCNLDGSKTGLDGFADTIAVSNSRFYDNLTATIPYSNTYTRFSYCNFISNGIGIDWNGGCRLRVEHSNILGNQTGIQCFTVSDIYHCVIDSNSVYGIYKESGTNDTVSYNEIRYNGTGYATAPSGGGGLTRIHHNLFSTNGIGFFQQNTGAVQVDISQNCFCGNTIYNFKNLNQSNVSIPNNNWCAPDSASMAQTIYDAHDNIAYGLVDFLPMGNGACEIVSGMPASLQPHSFSFVVSPNPVSGTALLRLEEPVHAGHLFLYSASGALVLEAAVDGQQALLDLSTLSPGLYFLEISSGDKIAHGKLIRQ